MISAITISIAVIFLPSQVQADLIKQKSCKERINSLFEQFKVDYGADFGKLNLPASKVDFKSDSDKQTYELARSEGKDPFQDSKSVAWCLDRHSRNISDGARATVTAKLDFPPPQYVVELEGCHVRYTDQSKKKLDTFDLTFSIDPTHDGCPVKMVTEQIVTKVENKNASENDITKSLYSLNLTPDLCNGDKPSATVLEPPCANAEVKAAAGSKCSALAASVAKERQLVCKRYGNQMGASQDDGAVADTGEQKPKAPQSKSLNK